MDAREIAKGLTKAQREAMLSFGTGIKYSHDRVHSAVYHHLNCKRLAIKKWSPMPREAPWALTPLGLEVRAILQEQSNER